MNVAAILASKGTDVATIARGAPVSEAIAVLRRWGVGALVVSDDGCAILGVVSERDVVRGLAEVGVACLDHPVAELMSTNLRTCRPTDIAEQLMAVMTEQRVRHLPVVDDAGMLCGIVSIGDVVKARVEALERDQAQLVEYVRTGH